MRLLALALLAILVCVSCTARADGDATMLAADTWYIHGITVTSTGAPVGGGTVELWRGAVLVDRKVMDSQSFMFGARAVAGTYQVRYAPPSGWQCVSVNSVGIGWRYPGACVAEIVLPQYAPGIGPDVVFTVGPSVQTPTRTATLHTPTATRTATATPTEFPTIPMPPATPPIPTPRPMPTPPPGGFEVWADPPAEIINAMVPDWEWWLAQFESDDPLQLAANAKYGAAWPLGAPLQTRWEYAGTAVRWQCFVTPKGVVFAFAMAAEPYRVALVDW